MKLLRKIIKSIAVINDVVGEVFSFLIIPMILLLVIEVVRRYGFNDPTEWCYPVSSGLQAYLVFLGGGYVLLHEGFLRMDVVYNLFPVGTRTVINLVLAPFGFIFCAVLLWIGTEYAIESVSLLENSGPPLYLPIYPFKVALPIGVFFLSLQWLAEFIGNLATAITGKQL